MWIRSGDGYAADSLRYRVAKVHRDAEWSPLEKHLSSAKERSLLTIRMRELWPSSSCRRRREVATGSATHPLLFDLLLGHPRLQLMRERHEVLPPTLDMLAA